MTIRSKLHEMKFCGKIRNPAPQTDESCTTNPGEKAVVWHEGVRYMFRNGMWATPRGYVWPNTALCAALDQKHEEFVKSGKLNWDEDQQGVGLPQTVSGGKQFAGNVEDRKANWKVGPSAREGTPNTVATSPNESVDEVAPPGRPPSAPYATVSFHKTYGPEHAVHKVATQNFGIKHDGAAGEGKGTTYIVPKHRINQLTRDLADKGAKEGTHYTVHESVEKVEERGLKPNALAPFKSWGKPGYERRLYALFNRAAYDPNASDQISRHQTTDEAEHPNLKPDNQIRAMRRIKMSESQTMVQEAKRDDEHESEEFADGGMSNWQRKQHERANSQDAGERLNVAHGRDTHRKTLDKLSKDRDVRVRRAVAANPNTHRSILGRLADDSDNEVRASVANHYRTPTSVMQRLTNDSDRYVRAYAKMSLKRDSEVSYNESVDEKVSESQTMVQEALQAIRAGRPVDEVTVSKQDIAQRVSEVGVNRMIIEFVVHGNVSASLLELSVRDAAPVQELSEGAHSGAVTKLVAEHGLVDHVYNAVNGVIHKHADTLGSWYPHFGHIMDKLRTVDPAVHAGVIESVARDRDEDQKKRSTLLLADHITNQVTKNRNHKGMKQDIADSVTDALHEHSAIAKNAGETDEAHKERASSITASRIVKGVTRHLARQVSSDAHTAHIAETSRNMWMHCDKSSGTQAEAYVDELNARANRYRNGEIMHDIRDTVKGLAKTDDTNLHVSRALSYLDKSSKMNPQVLSSMAHLTAHTSGAGKGAEILANALTKNHGYVDNPADYGHRPAHSVEDSPGSTALHAYHMRTAEISSAKCWTPHGGHPYCVNSHDPAEATKMANRYGGFGKGIYVLTKQDHTGHMRYGAYLPAMLVSDPANAVRDARNMTGMPAKYFDRVYGMLRHLDVSAGRLGDDSIAKHAHKYTTNPEVLAQAAKDAASDDAASKKKTPRG